MDYNKCATEILDAIGGKDNLASAAHCATRLRLVIADNGKVKKSVLENIDGVKGVFEAAGQLQVIIGTGTVNKVYDEFIKLAGVEAASKDDVKKAAAAKAPWYKRAIKTLGDIFVPIIPAIVATGLLCGLLGGLSKAFPDMAGSHLFGLLDIFSNAALTFLPILQYGPSVESVPYPGWSELLEAFYAQRDRAEHMRSRAKSMAKLVRNALGRTERKLSARIGELGATEDRELDKRRGDLITANIWRMKPGMAELVTEDFYEEDGPTVTIPLDTRKSPQQNAAAYYKQYTKKKAAREHLTTLIEENTAEREYLGSVAEEIARAQSQGDLEDIREELVRAGYLRAPKASGKKTKKPKPVPPLRFITSSGLEVLVGRNNLQNDELTFKTARRTDLWLHALKLHGAHVILRCEDREPPERDVYEAACLAAYYSEGAQGGKVPVDAAQVRFVKKPRGARPGKVIYTDQRTILAEPRKEI